MYFAIEFSSLVKESPGSPIGYASDLLCGRKGIYTLDASRGTPLLFVFPFFLLNRMVIIVLYFRISNLLFLHLK